MPLTTEVYASTVIGVPSYAAAGAFTDTLGIKEYGQNSIIACCILETSMDSTAIDTVRRIVLSLSNFESSVLRERLVSVDQSAQRTRVRMDYVPFGLEEAHRSPLGVEGNKKLKSASTLISVSEVTTNPNMCFVDMTTTLVIDVDVSPNGLIHGDDNDVYTLIHTFWKMYLTRTITALESHLLSIAFPAVAPSVVERLEKEFTEVEDVVCEWSARSTPNISRLDALQLLERSLLGWERARRELQNEKIVSARLEADLDGARAVAAAAAQSAAAAMVSSIRSRSAAETEESPQPPEPAPRRAVSANRTQCKTVADSSPNVPVCVDRRKQPDSDVRIPFFEHGGGRALSLSQHEHLVNGSQLQEQEQAVPVLRPSPRKIDAKLIEDVVSGERGTINERDAELLFSVLDETGEGFITANEIAMILKHIDTHGLYEDKDGTIEQMDECRAAVGTGVFRHDGRPPSSAKSRVAVEVSKTELEPLAEGGEEKKDIQLTPLQAAVRRLDMQKSLMQKELICKRSNDLVSKFAYKTRGKIHYDEFCLMMLHILGNF